MNKSVQRERDWERNDVDNTILGKTRPERPPGFGCPVHLDSNQASALCKRPVAVFK